MAEIERIESDQIEVFDNKIAEALAMFCEEQEIKDIRRESQNVWNAALMYIRRYVFPTSDILRRDKPLDGYSNNNYNNQYSNLNNTNCNSYDIDLVNSVCDYYIYICNLYDKGVTITGFCKLTGISETVIYEWGHDDRKLSHSSSEIYKKLSREYENSAESKLWANKNPVAVMAILNKRFGWNLPGVSKEQSSRQALTADKLPDLGAIEQKKD